MLEKSDLADLTNKESILAWVITRVARYSTTIRIQNQGCWTHGTQHEIKP